MTRFTGKSFKSILDLNKGAGLGFDLLRLGLAIMVVICHGSHLANHSGTTASITRWLHDLGILAGPAIGAHPPTYAPLTVGAATVTSGGIDPVPVGGLYSLSGPVVRSLIPMFFALSGFLVSGSAFRAAGLLQFLGLRALRILPALFVEVTLSAIILGAIFTTLSLYDYYTSSMFRAYFLNILGIIQFKLPGVFEHAYSSSVNANLWTIPSELDCYFLMSVLIILGLLRRRALLTILFVAATLYLIIANVFFGYMAKVEVYPGPALVFCFVVGMMFYLWRDKIVFHPLLFITCLIVSYVMLWYPTTTFITPLFLTYVTVFIGLMPLPQLSLLKSGDYSYGIYLYGYPIMQSIVAVLGNKSMPYPLLVLLTIAITSSVAVLSWHGVEKHFLKLKRFLSKPSALIAAELHPDLSEPDTRTAVAPTA